MVWEVRAQIWIQTLSMECIIKIDGVLKDGCIRVTCVLSVVVLHLGLFMGINSLGTSYIILLCLNAMLVYSPYCLCWHFFVQIYSMYFTYCIWTKITLILKINSLINAFDLINKTSLEKRQYKIMSEELRWSSNYNFIDRKFHKHKN